MFNMFGNMFGRLFSPAFDKQEEERPVFESADAPCKSDLGYNPYCDGVRCYDRDDLFPVAYTEEELRSIYYDLNQEDGMDLLVESADFDDVDDFYNPGTEEVDRDFVLEAITVKKFSRLEGVITRGMLPSMRKHMKVTDPTTGEPITVLDPIVGKPKKSGSFAYVTAQIPFSDGQVVSIVFHAPEGDGKKIGPSDMVVAFRWLLNKRDITAVVAPEDGKEVSLETISLRLAQLVGKNAKRFASTQKEVQAETKQLEELTETRKEREEQTKVWEDKIAGNRLRKEESDANNSRLEAQLANQLAVNRELEVRLAGLRKLEEEAGKNEPEPAGGTEPGKDAEPKPADKEEPSFVAPLNDVIAGKYDNDTDEMYRQIFYAWDNYRLDDSFGQPEYKALFNRAITHRRDIFLAFYEKVKDTANLPKHADVKASIEKMFARFEKDTSPEYKMERLNEIEEAFSWLGYSDLNSGETEPSPQITDPEPVPTEPIAPQTATEPDWLKSMHDIIDGKYDNHDTREIGRLIDVAIEELDKPGCDPKWEEIANEAADHLTELIKAKAKAAGF